MEKEKNKKTKIVKEQDIIKDSDYEVKSNTLLMKNAIKIDLNKNNQTDANADNTDVSNGINTTSDVNNTDNNTTTKTNTQY